MKEQFDTLEEAREFADKQYYDGFLYVVKDETMGTKNCGKYYVMSHNALHTYVHRYLNLKVIESWDYSLRLNV